MLIIQQVVFPEGDTDIDRTGSFQRHNVTVLDCTVTSFKEKINER